MSKTSTSTSTHLVINFITSTDQKTTSVCHWEAVCVQNLAHCSGTDLDNLFNIIRQCHVTRVYIHDDDYCMSYIYNYLINNGVIYDSDINDNVNVEGSFNQFTLNGTTYYIKYKYVYGVEYTRTSTCTFVSSKKLLRNSISDIGKLFNIYDVTDTTLQFCMLHRLTEKDIQTTYNSAYVVAKFLKEIKKDIALNELTIGSCAVKSWMHFDNDNFKDDKIKLQDLFCNIPIDIERDLYKSYRGGYNYINKKYIGLNIQDGVVLDCNSLFPYTMKNYDCPIGVPTWYDYDNNLPDDDYYIIKLIIGGDKSKPGLTVKKDHIPTISSLSTGEVKNYYLENVSACELWLTGFDFNLLVRHYDIHDLSMIGFYKFDHMSGIFENFINYWYNIKQNSKGPIREISKLFLDNIHGKLGTKIEVLTKKGYVHTKNQIVIKDNDRIKFDNGDDTEVKGIRYIPASIFINSISRYYMINIAQKYFDRLIYMDTDSIHLIGMQHVNGIDIGPNLGQFKVESLFKRARYLGLKSYIHDEYNDFDKFDKDFNHDNSTSLDVTLAGASDLVTSQLNFDNFYTGTIIYYSKTVMNNINGGKIRRLIKYKITQGAQKN